MTVSISQTQWPECHNTSSSRICFNFTVMTLNINFVALHFPTRNWKNGKPYAPLWSPTSSTAHGCKIGTDVSPVTSCHATEHRPRPKNWMKHDLNLCAERMCPSSFSPSVTCQTRWMTDNFKNDLKEFLLPFSSRRTLAESTISRLTSDSSCWQLNRLCVTGSRQTAEDFRLNLHKPKSKETQYRESKTEALKIRNPRKKVRSACEKALPSIALSYLELHSSYISPGKWFFIQLPKDRFRIQVNRRRFLSLKRAQKFWRESDLMKPFGINDFLKITRWCAKRYVVMREIDCHNPG